LVKFIVIKIRILGQWKKAGATLRPRRQRIVHISAENFPARRPPGGFTERAHGGSETAGEERRKGDGRGGTGS